MDATRDALERALLDRPDDVATHSAYADYLAECGDPRGDYIRLQLALEDRTQSVARIRQMEQAAYELRRRHEEEWLGPLYRFANPPRANRSVAEPVAPNVEVTFQRGWLHALHIAMLTDEIVEAVAGVPTRGLLQELTVEYQVPGLVPAEQRGETEVPEPTYPSIRPWVAAGVGAGLRRLKFGEGIYSGPVWFDAVPGELGDFLATAPRLESLHIDAHILGVERVFNAPLPCLQELSVRVNRTIPAGYDLGVIGRNPSFARLHTLAFAEQIEPPLEGVEWAGQLNPLRSLRLAHLRIQTPAFADDGVRALCDSGLLRQLRTLHLPDCNITDDGAERLAAHPDLGRLEALELADNSISPIGFDALARAGFRISQRQNLGPGPGEGFADDEIPF